MSLKHQLLMRRFAGDLFEGMELTSPDPRAIVHAFDVDDTLTRKPEGFDNTGLTKDQFFDASRDFPADEAVVDLAKLLHSKGDRIAIATARPADPNRNNRLASKTQRSIRSDHAVDWS